MSSRPTPEATTVESGGLDAPRSPGRRRAASTTATDVARAVGVSQSTVSLVLSGKAEGRVGPDTRRAVLEAAAAMGYQPNAAARALRSGRAQTIALVIPDIENPVYASLLLGVSGEVRAADYAVVLVDERENPQWERSLVSGLAGGLFGGGILHTPAAARVGSVARTRRPYVLIESAAPGTSSVQLRVTDGVRAAMSHLLALGHRRIGHVAAAYDKETFHLRRRAWLDALARAGIDGPRHEVAATWELDEAQLAVGGLLGRADRPTALLCDDDLLAAAAYRAARAAALAIPGDLSVVGFDDIPLARYLEPELTTIAFPGFAVGRTAAALLLRHLADRRAKPEQVELELPLVVRGSTAAPPADARARGRTHPPSREGPGHPGKERNGRSRP